MAGGEQGRSWCRVPSPSRSSMPSSQSGSPSLQGSLVSMPATPSSSCLGVCFPVHEADTAAHWLALRMRIRDPVPLGAGLWLEVLWRR